MKPGFYIIMAAQFFSSLADNALFIAALFLLQSIHAPEWMEPQLKLFFTLSYVIFAAFVGILADNFPKGRVMMVTNLIKVLGCALMLIGVHPLIAYGIVGIGAAAYSPAKYGILTELLPPEKLVAANGWIEGLTVGSIILGAVCGGILIGTNHYSNPNHISTYAISIILSFYFIAAFINMFIPKTGVVYAKQNTQIDYLIKQFYRANIVLWKDKLGQISLAVTTLFWGIGAALQLIVLWWAESALGLGLSQGAILQATSGIGVALGAVYAARKLKLKQSLTVIPYGILMGVLVLIMTFFDKNMFNGAYILLGSYQLPLHMLLAYVFLILIGALSGYFVVPMNALLQYRGHILLSAGQSIAVQNFNENLSILVMLAILSIMRSFMMTTIHIIIVFSLLVISVMYLIWRKHQYNTEKYNYTQNIPTDA
jgi:MFS transporter, LPLT family, lysophospholipid transporter